MKIFANSIAEKTKSERDADIFKMRYTEKHQSENININEIKSRIIRVRWGGQILFRIAERICAPSRLSMGRRFNIPRRREEDDILNRSSFGKYVSVRFDIQNRIRLAAGPAAQTMISLL